MRKKGRVSAFALILILALICAILLITAAAVDNQRTYNREKAVTPTPSITPRTVRITEAPGQPTLSPTPRLLQVNSVGLEVKELQERLRELLGKGGEQLWLYANGLDDEPVRLWGDAPEIKSVSRGMTFRRDLVKEEEVSAGIASLVDHVAMTLRRHSLKGAVINVQIKTPALRVISRQTSLDHHTYLQHEIREVAMALIHANWQIGPDAPIRALTVGVSKLLPADQSMEQTDFLDLASPAEVPKQDREKQEKMEAAVDTLRRRFGNDTITLGYQRAEEIGIRREHKQKKE